MTRSQAQAKKRKKRGLLIATLAVAAIIVIALTFAWYTSKDSVTNTFQTSGSFKTVVVENFVPPTDWEPGATTDKVVQVTNTGTIDAYVRADFDYDMTFYMKNGNTTEISDTFSIQEGNYYATVDTSAIEAAVDSAGFDEYDEVSYGLGLTVPTGVTLYVKKSTGETTVESSTVVETEKYEFLAYYTDTNDNNNNKTYEVDIAVDNTDLSGYGYSDEDGFIVVKGDTSDVSSALKFSLYNTDKYTTDATATGNNVKTLATIPTDPAEGEDEGVINDIFDVITLNFYNTNGNGELDTDNWYKNDVTDANGNVTDTYYYYRNVLESGATTTALLDSVTFNGKVPNITDLVFNLTVNMDSTQALVDAAVATFSATDAWVAQDTNGNEVTEADKYNTTKYATTVLSDGQQKYADGSNTDNKEDSGSGNVEQP